MPKKFTPTVGQMLMVGLPGTELAPDTSKILKQVQPGAFIIFGRNIKSAVQLRKLIDDIRDISENEPIITIDQEGGRVSRLRMIGEEPPSAQQLREKGDLNLIKKHGELTGELLRLFGFNLDLCPVLDISCNGDEDNSLRGRCYGLTPVEVVEKASAFNSALKSRGILTCGKHFPGYSRAKIDAHNELPVIPVSFEELQKNELIPFYEMLTEIDSIMVCHAHYPAFDKGHKLGKIPASLSENVVANFIKTKMAFKGLVMTDDLDMGAILNFVELEDCLNLAINAGNDLAMICHRTELIPEAEKILAKLPTKIIDARLEQVGKFKAKLAEPKKFSEEKFAELNDAVWQLRVATLGEEQAKIKSVEDGQRSPVETY